MKHYWVYMLECDNGSYYTGYTDDLVKRYREHRAGTYKSRYTRSFRPVKVACCWKVEAERGVAMRVESFIKAQTRKVKDDIVGDPAILGDFLAENGKGGPSLVPVDPGTLDLEKRGADGA